MVVNIPAGGIRFASNIEYDNDEDVICHFELPGSICFVLPAQIVRVPRLISCRKRQDERWRRVLWARQTNRSQLLRRVYREQARRHREEPKD
jgi:hypothetical protein